MLTIYRDADAEITEIASETVAVLGYGIQGRAQAHNLRDSGITVVVGNRDDHYRTQAVEDGFPVHEIAEAANLGDILLILVPDEVQQQLFVESIVPALRPGKAVVFAHGFALRYGLVQPPRDVDLLLCAPRMPGPYVRNRFLAGSGVPAYVNVEHDATGRAKQRLFALAKALGFTRAGALEVSAATEAELDHFSEHFTYPFVFYGLQVAVEELVKAGYPPEIAVMESYGSGELGQVLQKAAEIGLWHMLASEGSPICQYGVHQYKQRVVPEGVRETIQRVLAEVRDGSFARDAVQAMAQGYPALRTATEQALSSPLTQAEDRLRAAIAGAPQGASS